MSLAGNTFIGFEGVMHDPEGTGSDTGERIGRTFTATMQVFTQTPGRLTPAERREAVKFLKVGGDILKIQVTELGTLH